MTYREATINDIGNILIVRKAVKENILSNPDMITAKDCEEYLTVRGKGWVCERNNEILGFGIADLRDNNIWALFVHPDFEKKGVGKKLLIKMLNWYFQQGKDKVWLGTSPNTRAETFYRKLGWKEIGKYGKNEIKFEMTISNWKNSK